MRLFKENWFEWNGVHFVFCMHRSELRQRGESCGVQSPVASVSWLCGPHRNTMWLGQRKSGIIVTDLSEWGIAEVRCDDCRCHAARRGSAAVPDVIISPLFKVSHAAQTQSALRNHHNNCANLQLALKFLLSSCPPWRLNDTLPAHCNIQRMIRNAGPSSDRGRISPNGCLSFIISPNWAWAACTPLAPGSPGIWWNDKFVSGARSLVSSLVIPRGPAPGRNSRPGRLTSRQEVLRNRDLRWGWWHDQGEEPVTVMRVGQRLTDYLEKFCKTCHGINQPPGSGLGSGWQKAELCRPRLNCHKVEKSSNSEEVNTNISEWM